MRARLLLLSAWIVACSSPATPIDGAAGDARAGEDGGVDARAIDDASSDASDAPTSDAPTSDAAVPTRLRIVYPSGHTITVRGALPPLRWDRGLPAEDLGIGVYEILLPGLAAETELKPLLDDATWSRGPNYHLAPGATTEIAPHFVATTGRVTALLAAWASPSLGNTRAVDAYLPAAYDENTAARFPVLYMHDGQNLFDASLAFGGNEWRVDETMDAAGERGLCADGRACQSDGDCGGARCDTFESTIVVGIANTASRIDEYTPTVDVSYGGGHADAYLAAVLDELRPQVDATLRTRTAREDTAMMGSSLGGLVSAYAGVVHADAIGRIGAMSPSTWWDMRTLIDDVATIPSRAVRADRVYVDSGDAGASMDGVTDTADLAAAYRAAGYVEGESLRYVVQPGGMHNEIYWAERLPAALAFLLPPRERAAP